MCSTYFFKKYPDKICYADTDIPLKEPPHPEPERQGEEPKRVGNHPANHGNNGYGNKWIYRTKSDIRYPNKDDFFGWNELLCIELDTEPRRLVYSNRTHDKLENRDRRRAMRRFPRPDLVLKFEEKKMDLN